jgi:hypothetical protein
VSLSMRDLVIQIARIRKNLINKLEDHCTPHSRDVGNLACGVRVSRSRFPQFIGCRTMTISPKDIDLILFKLGVLAK